VAFVERPTSGDPHDQLLLQIQGAIAEHGKAVLGERFRRGKLRKARAGQWVTGKAPDGYRYVFKRDGVPGHLVVEPAEAEVVRMLYRWLIDERMTVRQILKRLAQGPWRPRHGKRLWSSCVVHHILSDPAYTGTTYANRHTYVVPRKPRMRGPRAGEATRRRPRPREEWIPMPVPAIIDESTHQGALAQVARNSVLNFRRSTRNSYLLVCRTCGLAMHGTTTRDKQGNLIQGYYRCHGKDPAARDRGHRCPQSRVEVEELDAAVWAHVCQLLNDPVPLPGQDLEPVPPLVAEHVQVTGERVLAQMRGHHRLQPVKALPTVLRGGADPDPSGKPEGQHGAPAGRGPAGWRRPSRPRPGHGG
jgi:site-specific DNA recombinase